MSHGDSWHSVKEKSRPSQRQCDNSELVPREELRPSPSFTNSSLKNGRQGLWTRQNKCFGMIEWECGTKLSKLPSPQARSSGSVEALPKDRGAEQGDVNGPLKCSLALETVAAEARLAEQQAAGTLSRVGAHDLADAERLQGEQHDASDVPANPQLDSEFVLGGTGKLARNRDRNPATCSEERNEDNPRQGGCWKQQRGDVCDRSGSC